MIRCQVVTPDGQTLKAGMTDEPTLGKPMKFVIDEGGRARLIITSRVVTIEQAACDNQHQVTTASGSVYQVSLD